MIKIRTRLFKNWDKHVRRQLMRLDLQCGNFRRDVKERPTSRTWVAFEGEMVVGWLAFIHFEDCLGNKNIDVQLYTRRSHRRQGIGSKLYKTAMRWKRKNNVRPKTEIFPDPENRAFFKAIGRPDAGIDWWDKD